MTTTGALLSEHPTNPIDDLRRTSNVSKEWTKTFNTITKVNVCTIDTLVGETTRTTAAFDGPLLPEYEDDTLRFNMPAFPLNYREYVLDTELDGANWFHTEVSNPVLAAWARYPGITQRAHQASPAAEHDTAKIVDVTYSVNRGLEKTEPNERIHVAIGEFKRGLIDIGRWRTGKISGSSLSLTQELRG